MNTTSTQTTPPPNDPAKRGTRTHRKERTVPHRKNRRTRQLFSAYRANGDTAARDILYQSHFHIAEFYARKYSDRGIDYDDLIQEAGLGLLKAIERYDPSRGAAFSTYASYVIDGTIKEYFRDVAWPCSAPRKAKKNALLIKEMMRSLGRLPTKQEVIDAGIIPECDVDAAIAASQAWSIASLSADDPCAMEAKEPGPLSCIEQGYELASSLLDVETAIQKLSEREMRIARMHYFDHLSQRDIAQQMGISATDVSRLLRRAKRQLDREFKGTYRAS